MNILQLNFERGWRGGERQTLLCMEQLRRTGHTVSLLAREGGELAARARDGGFTVHAVANMTGVCRFLLGPGRRYAILHAQTANMVTWLAILKPWLKGTVFTRRTAFPVPSKRESRTAWKWRRVDALVAISEAAAEEPRRLGLPVQIIPSAVEIQPLDEARVRAFAAEYSLDGKLVLATAAALTREKDPCTLLRAVHRLRQTREDFVFLHLGAGGDAQEEAYALHKTLDLGRHYIFAGFQTGVESLYRLMDAFVLCSRHEALGTSVLDAFLYGVPVVATNTGGLAQLLADDRGLLCEVGDDQALADAMARILADRSLRAGIIERARNYVCREHDPSSMAARYLKIYKTIAGTASQDVTG
ncbi:glycosyltransferase family 4 protein [Allopusillimonas ginsengisoli]|uniref:glycosyltransferase family 4 protein n=1 Tax=Allopusillimonas ginsengisoli TaxID=453575 RepID=UPI0010229504|nr:glycosyltransferase family 4 protein [Allopusillimonas ginsengisoli]TEA76909.1 glycosyltransferase family 1 protein [Allopusillimonas ginsengisoli]